MILVVNINDRNCISTVAENCFIPYNDNEAKNKIVAIKILIILKVTIIST